MLYNDDDDADSDELGVPKSGFKFCEFGGFCTIVLIFWPLFFWMGSHWYLWKNFMDQRPKTKVTKSLKNMFLIWRKIKRTILNKYGMNCRENITKSLLNFQKRPVLSDWYTNHHFIADVPRQKAGRQGLHLCICSVIIHNSSVFLHSRCRLSILCIYIDTEL